MILCAVCGLFSLNTIQKSIFFLGYYDYLPNYLTIRCLSTRIRAVFIILNVVFTCFFKEKKTRLFWSGEIFIQDCLIPSNRSITVCHGTFWFGFLWLGLFYAYWSISQKSVKGVVIQVLLIMGGNSKKWDELREKSTRAILVTQAVNALGYSILASVGHLKQGVSKRSGTYVGTWRPQ